MEDPVCVVLVGLPGTGKSYMRNEVLSHLKDAFVYSTDDEIENVAQSRGLTYDDVFQSEYKNVKKDLDVELNLAISKFQPVIWDQTNVTSKKRKNIIEKIRSKGYTVYCYCVVHPYEGEHDYNTWMERLAKRKGKTIPEKVILTMKENFELPTAYEGFDDVRFFDIRGQLLTKYFQ